jgi:hypothetical protein
LNENNTLSEELTEMEGLGRTQNLHLLENTAEKKSKD